MCAPVHAAAAAAVFLLRSTYMSYHMIQIHMYILYISQSLVFWCWFLGAKHDTTTTQSVYTAVGSGALRVESVYGRERRIRALVNHWDASPRKNAVVPLGQSPRQLVIHTVGQYGGMII